MKRLAPLALVAVLLGVQAFTAQGPSAAEAAADGVNAAATTSPAAGPEVAELQRDLTEIVGRPGWSGDRWSVMVLSLAHHDTLFALGHTTKLAPASNLKLFTTAAALYYLGPDFRFNTFLMSTGQVRDSVLEGDVILYGTGDPGFSDRFGNKMSVFRAFADTLKAHGIREIRGDVVGDGSYFEGPGTADGWQESYMNASYAASSGALSFAENLAALRIAPAETAGHRPTVTLVPGGEGIAVVNQATTVTSGSTRITAARIAYDGPVLIRGQIRRGAAPVVRVVTISDPARYTAAIFRGVLEDSDITVHGDVRSAATAAESPVTGRTVFAPALDSVAPVRVHAVHTSEPIQQVLDIINKRSHNLMAEQVLRTVGRVAVGDGSVEGGARAVTHMIEQSGAKPDITIRDGSGLSVLNRASARDFIQLLALMAESPMWPAYWESLPESGARGGLGRMQRTKAEGNLRAKTGTINNVSALSGYVTAANGERLAFSIISNNVPSTWMAKRVEDAIGARLAEFSRPLPASQPMGVTGESAAATPAPKAAEPATPSATERAPAAATTHTIRSGDTFDGIAKRYDITVRALQQANPGLNPRRLIPGRTVKLP